MHENVASAKNEYGARFANSNIFKITNSELILFQLYTPKHRNTGSKQMRQRNHILYLIIEKAYKFAAACSNNAYMYEFYISSKTLKQTNHWLNKYLQMSQHFELCVVFAINQQHVNYCVLLFGLHKIKDRNYVTK